jgi:hypothetical protein
MLHRGAGMSCRAYVHTESPKERLPRAASLLPLREMDQTLRELGDAAPGERQAANVDGILRLIETRAQGPLGAGIRFPYAAALLQLVSHVCAQNCLAVGM